MSRSIAITAPAKVNLCLSVGTVRADGYHAVDTVLHCLEFADIVTISPAERLSVRCVPSVGVPEERNLAYRAAAAFGAHFSVETAFAVHIEKRVPHGAGLGGGSSDAAAVIAGLAYLHDVDRADPGCLAVAALLGADVAFFLHGPAALMSGRGERLVRELPPMDVPVVLVKPAPPVPTGGAYAAFDSSPQPPLACDDVVRALATGDQELLVASLANNMEVAASSLVPDVAVALAWTRAQTGAAAALLAGSGSAVFALTDSTESARRIAADAAARGWWSQSTALGVEGIAIADIGDTQGEDVEGE